MVGPPSQPPARGGMSLYANLLETDSSTSISRDPLLNNEFKDGASAKKTVDPAFRFQPIRRPQVKQPVKPKPAFPKAPAVPAQAAAPAATAPASATASTAAVVPRSTLADWAATEEDDYYYAAGEKRQRGGRRKKKKKTDDVPRETDWDELYDPARPTNVEEYLRSDERIREVREWKAVLYAHRRQKRSASYGSGPRSEDEEEKPRFGNQFAPPASLSFAPPPMSPPRATAPTLNDTTGDDAYARRLAMSGQAPPPPPPPPPAAAASPVPPPPPPPTVPPNAATISRAPVRYQPPPPPPDAMDLDTNPADEDEYDPEVDYASIPLPAATTTAHHPGDQSLPADSDETTPSSSRPGQKGFAQRLMAKYGWTRGAGLGAQGDGITSALRVQVERRRRRPDAEGGGFVDPKGGRGRIIAPKSKSTSKAGTAQVEQGGRHASADSGAGSDGGQGEQRGVGKLSTVVLLQNMLENMADLEAEVEAGLGQEIGEECGEQYGRVERIVVDVDGRRVLIRFVEAVSALRAVNALQGRIFNGNPIAARFYDEDKFEEGIYDG